MTLAVLGGVALCIPLVTLAVLARAGEGTWLAPGALFPLYWSVALIAPILFLPHDPVATGLILWITLAALVVFGAAAIAGRGGEAEVVGRGAGAVARPLAVVTVVLACIGAAAPLVALERAGYGLAVFTSVHRLVMAAAALSIGRYTETYVPPLASQAALPFLYAAPAFGGMLAALATRNKHKVIALVPFVPPLLMTASQTERTVTIASAMIWVSAYLASRLYLGKTAMFTRRHVIAGAVAGALAVMVFFAAAIARLGVTDLSYLSDVAIKIQGGFFGHARVLSEWFTSAAFNTPASPTWGQYTFAGLYDALGVGHRHLGLFSNSVVLASGDETNIYTLFRPLIEDFTPLGSLAALGILGGGGGLAYVAVRRGSFRAVPLLAAFYLTVFYSLITSVWIYNSLMAAMVIFGVGCVWLETIRRRHDTALRERDVPRDVTGSA